MRDKLSLKALTKDELDILFAGPDKDEEPIEGTFVPITL